MKWKGRKQSPNLQSGDQNDVGLILQELSKREGRKTLSFEEEKNLGKRISPAKFEPYEAYPVGKTERTPGQAFQDFINKKTKESSKDINKHIREAINYQKKILEMFPIPQSGAIKTKEVETDRR